MKKSICRILAVMMGVSMLPITAMAMEKTENILGTVEIADVEKQEIIEEQEKTELFQEELELEEDEAETKQRQMVEGEVVYHSFSLEFGAKAKLNLFEEASEGEYFLEEYAEYSDALEYTIQGEESAEEYIDRVTLPAFAEDFYDSLEEAVDGDGRKDYLMDPYYYSFDLNEDGFKIMQAQDEDGNDVNHIVYAVVEDIELKSEDDAQAVVNGLYEAAAKAYSAFDRDHPEVFWLTNEMGFLSGGYCTYMQDGNRNEIEGTRTYYVGLYFSLANDEGGKVKQIRSDEFLDDNGENISINGEVFADLEDVANYPYQLAAQNIDSFDAVEGEYAYDGTGPAFRTKYDIPESVVFEDLTDAGKVAYFDFWLTRNADYNTDVAVGNEMTLSSPYECISALWAEGGTEGPVCEGYARAVKLLCEVENIDCVLVTGDSGPAFDGKEDHMWNNVKIDDKWYALDTTWNDPVNDDPWTGYLLVGSGTFKTDHHWMNLGFNKEALPEGPEIESDKFPREGNWMMKPAVEVSEADETVTLKIRPAQFELIKTMAEEDAVKLITALFDQMTGKMLDVQYKECAFGELSSWTVELNTDGKTDLKYQIFLVAEENLMPIMEKIGDDI
ncbi:transglutaminase domain-containing protein [Anaerotignum sp.]|nr:transglutaminase domain-containing protein [Anaerotignum sp.]MBQ7758663.1 hypothetical protein [Anaerotignum sp.]